LHWKTIVYTLGVVRFAWDPEKAAANLRAHGVTFAEAVTVFEDVFALTGDDAARSDEDRFVTLGLSDAAKLLVVVYTYREPDTIRIISAWEADKREEERYGKGRC